MEIVGRGAAEKYESAGEVGRFAPAGGGDSREDGGVAGFVGAEGGGVVGGDVAGGDGVDVDAFACPLVGEGFGERGDAAFAGGISGDGDAALEGEERGGEDDFSGAAGDHLFADFAGEDELRVEVHFDDFVPVFVGMLGSGFAEDGAGVVDEDVDLWVVGFDLFDEGVKGISVGEVAGVAGEFSASGGDGFFNFRAMGLEGGGDGEDVSTGFGEGDGHGHADAALGAGDESGFSVEFELVQDHDTSGVINDE